MKPLKVAKIVRKVSHEKRNSNLLSRQFMLSAAKVIAEKIVDKKKK
jgi:hypothetical protein